MNFNLIISTFRNGEEEARNEILNVLASAGDSEAKAEVTGIVGIILGFTNIDPFHVVQIFRELVMNRPWENRYVLRLLPIEAVVPTQLQYIVISAKKLALKIKKQEAFRITIEKRHNSLRSSDIIREVAENIDNPVNLCNPDWIILVEIVGKLTGLSVLRPASIFSSVIEKRKNFTL